MNSTTLFRATRLRHAVAHLVASALVSVALATPTAALAQKKPAKPAGGDKKSEQLAAPKSVSADKTRNLLHEGAAAQEARPAQSSTSVGPDVSANEQADKKRDEAIQTLQDIIGRMQGQRDPAKADMMFQLAELYWEKAKYNYLQEMDQFNKAMDECQKANVTSPEKCDKQVKLDTRRSRSYQKQAWLVYEKILKDYPDYQRKDEVLLALGYSKYDAGEKLEGIRFLWDLTKQYPNSRFASDAYLRIGDHYFDTNNVFKAVKAFQKAASYNDPQTYTYATYKLAWCDYNLGEYDAAVDKFKQVIQTAPRAGAAGAAKRAIGLREEALRDIVLSFSQIDYIDEAKTYFESVTGPAETHKAVDALARIYDTQGKDSEGIRTFQLLIEMDPFHPKAPIYQAAIVQAYARQNNKKAVRDESRRLVDNYRPDSPWAQRNSGDQMALNVAADLTETTLRELVEQYHYQAQKLEDRKTYGLARDIYKEYLDRFPKSESANRLRFFYAEILFLMKDYVGAAKEYVQVVDEKPEGEYSKNAAYSAVLCYEQLSENQCENPRDKVEAAKKGAKVAESDKLKWDTKKEKLKTFKMDAKSLKKGESYDKVPFSECEEQLLGANDRFVKLVGEKDENYLPVKFKSAFTYYEHNYFEDAASRLNEIIQKYPKHPLAKKSALVVLDSFSSRNDYKNLHVYAKEFRKNDVLAEGEFAKELDRLIEGSAFYIVMDTYNAGKADNDSVKLKSAGIEFAKYSETYPESIYVEQALYNAMTINREQNRLDLAIDAATKLRAQVAKPAVQQRLAKKKEDDAFGKKASDDALWNLATLHQSIADFASSLKWYDTYFAEYGPKLDPKTKKPLKAAPAKVAAKPTKGAKEEPRAAPAEGDKKENSVDRVADALFLSAVFNDKMGNRPVAIEKYNLYMELYPTDKENPEHFFRVGELLMKQGNVDGAYRQFETYRKLHKDHSKGGRQVEAVYNMMQLSLKVNNKSGAAQHRKELKDFFGKVPSSELTPLAKIYIAGAAFDLVDPKFEEYRAIKFARMGTLRNDLTRKAKMLKELEAQYTDVLKIGVAEYGLAGLFRIGNLYEEFAKALFDAPVPRELSEEEAMDYKAALEERAFPLEEKAIEAYNLVLEKASEFAVYNEWTTKAQDHLNRLEQKSFPLAPVPDFVLDDSFAASPSSAESKPVSSL